MSQVCNYQMESPEVIRRTFPTVRDQAFDDFVRNFRHLFSREDLERFRHVWNAATRWGVDYAVGKLLENAA